MIITRSKLRCEKALDIIFRWCKNNKMDLNTKKSGILQLVRNKNSKWREVQINDIPVVEEYKYLGIWFDNKMKL